MGKKYLNKTLEIKRPCRKEVRPRHYDSLVNSNEGETGWVIRRGGGGRERGITLADLSNSHIKERKREKRVEVRWGKNVL